MSDQPKDGVKDDEPLTHHQTFPSSMTVRRRRKLQLMVSNGWASPLLRQMVALTVFAIFFLFKVALVAPFGVDPEACPCCLRVAATFLIKALCLPASISAKRRWKGLT